MPLILCPECNKQISNKAYCCPNCGLPFVHHETSNNETKKTKLPDNILTIKDIQMHLHISQQKAYNLIRCKGFPKITIDRYFIPKDKYLRWREENVKHTIFL